MYDIKQSTTAYPLLFFMTDSADHISGKTGLSPTVTISKAGAAFGSPAGAVTEISSGWYKVAGNATDANTLGPLALHATGSVADACDIIIAQVVAYDPQDTVRLGLTALPNAAAEAAGGLYTRGSGAGQIQQDANGRVDTNIVATATGAIDADALAADVITDIWQGTALTEAYAADGVAATPAQLLYMILSILAERNVSGTTLTCKKLDGSTTSMTFTLNSATQPTTQTRSG